ncbi:3-phosphoglycerate dehydrogenase family protein [Nannocystaceae bacterium ST9]
MRILVADKFSSAGLAAIEQLGHPVVYNPDVSADALPALLAEERPEVLVVRSTEVREAAFAAADRLSLVIRAGAGVNTIDLEAASRRGVFVSNCPGKNAIAVAELAMGLILALDRRICEATAELAAGSWNKKKYSKAEGVYGRRLGLVGFGAIGREVASRARAFGMRVSVFDPFIDAQYAAARKIEIATTLDELLSACDVISVHVPYRESTRHLIGARELGLMKKGALVIHTSRGGVVDDAALAEAVRAGHVRAGLDVFEGEPDAGTAHFELPLRMIEGIYMTPHVGASTEQASEAIAAETARIIKEFGERGSVPNVVNLVTDRTGLFNLVVRHLDRVGVLAGVLDALRRARINVQEMSNVVFKGAEGAASATIVLENEPSAELLDEIRRDANVLAVDLRSR